MIITTEPQHHPDADLQEVTTQHHQATSATRTLATALDVIPRLRAEIGRLRARLARTLADLHNLIAAARATLGAHADGEPGPSTTCATNSTPRASSRPSTGSGHDEPPLAPSAPAPGPPAAPRRLPADDGVQPGRPATRADRRGHRPRKSVRAARARHRPARWRHPVAWSVRDVGHEPIDLGPFEDAAPCRVLFMRRHVLFGGATGAGKSGGLGVLMGNLVACRDVVIWAINAAVDKAVDNY